MRQSIKLSPSDFEREALGLDGPLVESTEYGWCAVHLTRTVDLVAPRAEMRTFFIAALAALDGINGRPMAAAHDAGELAKAEVDALLALPDVGKKRFKDHGTVDGYDNGCRCLPCIGASAVAARPDAMTAYERKFARATTYLVHNPHHTTAKMLVPGDWIEVEGRRWEVLSTESVPPHGSSSLPWTRLTINGPGLTGEPYLTLHDDEEVRVVGTVSHPVDVHLGAAVLGIGTQVRPGRCSVTSLEEFLGDAYPEPESDGYGGYHIGKYGDALSEANWAMRKLAGLRAKQLEIKAAGIAETRRIDEWVAAGVRRHDTRAAFFEGALVAWHHAEMTKALAEAGGDWGKVKEKSQRLSTGTVVARKQPDRWDFEPVYVEWAQASWPDLVRTTVAPDKNAARKAFAVADGAVIDSHTGQVVPGVRFTPGEIAYSVTAAEAAIEEEDD